MHRSFDTAFKTQEYAQHPIAGEVCFGTLLDGAALPTKAVEDCLSEECSGCVGFVTCSVRQIDGYHVLYAMGCSDEYALLDVNSSNRLHVIESIETIRYEAMVETAMVKKRRRRSNSKSAPISLSINIFGQPSVAMEAGRRLSAASIFLQHPKALHKGIEYRNPQFLLFPEDTTDMMAFVGITNDSPSARRARISDEISSILDCLSDDPSGMTFEYTEHYGLLSALKPAQRHQVQGVCFMMQREYNPDPSLDSAKIISTPNRHGGGIIADAMGLGKTLTVLTAILQSSHKAALFRDFGSISNIPQEPKIRTKATLVVVSSAQLLESWGSEMQRHLSPECLNTIAFHGQSRQDDPKALLKADIVMTTYGTLVAEEKQRKVLQQLNWFRIVLDEVSKGKTIKKYNFLFTAILKMRMLCNSGTYSNYSGSHKYLRDPQVKDTGLNLTAANYVHIVEPQWNPSVEEQAVGRALRIGQTREVTVIRYIVQDTVEQNITQLQKKKKSAAKFMFNLGTSEELDGKLE
ncbi:putative SWI/SNF-related matrix-associated actin-dependent regulator of chromatin subfamily A member 3-like 1 [Colletotrichum siamense]|nr:putative SWI/SNF-related matrix-associated actin-dependent regulator of chromatin subfamily A member 3-like 1 [Colletotrichum siamense]